MKDKFNPYGFWRVTMPDGSGGERTKLLGYYDGAIDVIALALADMSYWRSLSFERCNFTLINDNEEPTENEIYIDVYNDSAHRDWTRYVHNVEDKGVGYSFHITSNNYADKVASALAKLTDEEKELLGL